MKANPLRRRLSQGLWWIGLALIAAGLLGLFASVHMPVPIPVLIGAGVTALGLNILLSGDLVVGSEPRVFTARGQVVRGELLARAALSDLVVSSGPNDRVASVRYGPIGRPDFHAESGVAHLRLRGGLLRPNIARWQADLASNVLWDIDARSSLGDLVLNLRDLRLERVTARTLAGRLAVNCPTRGYVQMRLKTGIGIVEVRIPPEVGVQVAIRRGELATVTIKNERLLALSQRRYTTHDFETAATQIEIVIESAAGDILLV